MIKLKDFFLFNISARTVPLKDSSKSSISNEILDENQDDTETSLSVFHLTKNYIEKESITENKTESVNGDSKCFEVGCSILKVVAYVMFLCLLVVLTYFFYEYMGK